jgi:hypothetical protein
VRGGGVAVREARARTLPQHRRGLRRRRRSRRHLPQDAHPPGSRIRREVLLRPRRPGIPGLRHRGRPGGGPGLLGPVVPRSRGLTALQGAEVILYPTAIGWDDLEDREVRPVQYQAWQTAMRAHAIANGVFVAASNRIGREGRLEFWGGSFVADPEGRVLHQSSHGGPEMAVVDCPATGSARCARSGPSSRSPHRRLPGPSFPLGKIGH